jgi:hypothetical protein
MIASDFEFRHQTLIHQLIVAAALLTYLFDRDDIVWHFVKDTSTPRLLERAVFIAATIAIAVGAGILTWARAHGKQQRSTHVESSYTPHRLLFLGDLFYVLGLATLFPLPGLIILVGGEALRIYRQIEHADQQGRSFARQPLPASSPVAPAHENELGPRWGKAFQKEAVKWGILLTMIVFVITLTDRLAEYMIAASFVVGSLLNAPFFSHSSTTDESS